MFKKAGGACDAQDCRTVHVVTDGPERMDATKSKRSSPTEVPGRERLEAIWRECRLADSIPEMIVPIPDSKRVVKCVNLGEGCLSALEKYCRQTRTEVADDPPVGFAQDLLATGHDNQPGHS